MILGKSLLDDEAMVLSSTSLVIVDNNGPTAGALGSASALDFLERRQLPLPLPLPRPRIVSRLGSAMAV